jgi:hypothetical protein
MKSFRTLSFIAIISLFNTGIHAQNAEINCPANMIVSAEPGKEGAIVNFPALAPELGGATISPASGSFFRLGSHSVIVTTASGQKCSFTVTVTDNEAPELSAIRLSRERIWPANGKLKKISVYYTTTDNGGKVTTTLEVSSNTTDESRDWEIVDEHQVRLRSVRLPDNTPRIYTLTVTASDEAGNKTTRTTSIAVSRTMTAVAAN